MSGKTVVDVTNALTPDMQLALGYSTSGAEQLQRKVPTARVVKCFNTVFAEHMDKGKVDDKTLDTAIGAVEKLQGLVKNADAAGGPGSGPGVTRELVKTKQYMMVYDPRTGQFTRQ